MKCKIIYIYDDKRKKRDLYELEQAIAKAGKAVNEKKLMGNPSGSGWRALVKTKKEEAENEDDKEMYQAVGLKDDVIEKRRKLAGYAAIVYEDPKSLKDSYARRAWLVPFPGEDRGVLQGDEEQLRNPPDVRQKE